MQVDDAYLQCLGTGLQALRASGQFCDAMVCVGSSRILVHKVVLSAASKTLHNLALDFDMTTHRERDQLEIIVPPDINLYSVNTFINFLYTGQLDLNSRIVNHLERLATLFGVSRLQMLCHEYIQRSSLPDSQNLNLQPDSIIEPDSSSKNGLQSIVHEERSIVNMDDTSQSSNFSRSNSVCSGLSNDHGLGLMTVKTEPAHRSSYECAAEKLVFVSSDQQPTQRRTSMNMLEKLMTPVVNLKKLPSTITPDVVVFMSDDENDGNEEDAMKVKKNSEEIDKAVKSNLLSEYSLEEKEAIALEAKRFGTLYVSKVRKIPITDVLNWMTLFGLHNPGNQQISKVGKHVNHEADLAIVRWIVQQQDTNTFVDLDCMRQYAITVYRETNPKFCASKTWLGNFLRRNMETLRGTKFVRGDNKAEVKLYNVLGAHDINVKKELISGEDGFNNESTAVDGGRVLENLGQNTVLETVPQNGEQMLKEDVLTNLNNDINGGDVEDDNDEEEDNAGGDDIDLSSSYIADESAAHPVLDSTTELMNQGSISTPFGKRPIIIGQGKSFDAKSEKKIVQWVLERQARDGYVFTDDFKDFARTLYKGAKPFGATQAWTKKFLRRNRALKDVKFCSKFKNTYSSEDKITAIALARRFGVAYAAKQTGFNQKVIHQWKLAADRGFLNVEPAALEKLEEITSNMVIPSILHGSENVSTSPTSQLVPDLGQLPSIQAIHGVVPEFEQKIVKELIELQQKEGSVNYDDISRISQEVYKETRPTFKACYKWIRSFLDRHYAELKDIDLENVSKVENDTERETPNDPISNERITDMVDQALKDIESQDINETKERKPVIIGPSVIFDRKTEKKLVEWVLEQQQRDGYVYTDDFKAHAKSLHTRRKHFSASSGWMSLFLRRHRVLKDVKWQSKYKSNYTEDEKKTAVLEAKRFGTGHVGRKLGIEPKLISVWKMKLEKDASKHQSFWKGTKIRKFGKGTKFLQPRFAPQKGSHVASGTEAARGIVPEFEQKIVELIQEEHRNEGSISYEEISSIAQSVYKETRPAFKASYAWIRNFLKRNEYVLQDLNIDNVKKVFIPTAEETSIYSTPGGSENEIASLKSQEMFHRRPIIVGQSRSLDTKTEKKLVQWVLEQQEKNGYVFLDQFKLFAQSLYKGSKKFAATQAWRIKFLRRNHTALKHVKFTSSFRNQYSLEEKKVIVQEAKKFGAAHVSKKTGIDHCLINAWRNKLERSGIILTDDPEESPAKTQSPGTSKQLGSTFAFDLKTIENEVGPGLYSYRGVIPAFEKKIVTLVVNKMDNEGSVSYQDVSNFARAVYKEIRPHFKASYNWIKEFLKRHKKALRHVDFEHTKKIVFEDNGGTEIIIPEDKIADVEAYMSSFDDDTYMDASTGSLDKPSISGVMIPEEIEPGKDPVIVIDNAEDPDYESHFVGEMMQSVFSRDQNIPEDKIDLDKIAAKRPIIIGKAKHFTRKQEKQIVEWLYQTQEREGFVFTDDFRRYARSLYSGPPEKFGATNAWISKFLRRNKLEKKIKFHSKLKGNNPQFEEKIVQLILEHQQKEGSVSNDDIQQITQSVYRETRPNFRACYAWIHNFIKRHKDKLAMVDFENIKRVFIPDDDGNGTDGVIINDFDASKSVPYFEGVYSSITDSGGNFNADDDGHNQDSSWMDLDSSMDQESSLSRTPQSTGNSSKSVLNKFLQHKQPIIIAPPKSLDIKTEKKLVQWMLEQQEKQGCVYLDLFKDYAKSIHTGTKKFAATQAWMVKFKQRNAAALKNVTMRSRFRNDYSMEEKVAIVEEAKRLGCNHVGRKLGINGGVIYSWKVQLEQAERIGLGPGESFGSEEALNSSRGVVPEFEKMIVEKTLEIQNTKGSVSNDDICQYAISLYKETRPNFKASYNWVMDFIRKHRAAFKDVVFENQKKVFTEAEKLHVLSEEKKYGTEHVVKKRSISASTLANWRRNMHARSIPIPKFKALVTSKIKKKYARGKNCSKTYTQEEKRKIVSVAEENGITHAALKLGISRSMLAKWIRYFRDQGEKIVINAMHGTSMKKELEQTIAAWVLEENEKLGIVLTKRIMEHAKKVFEDAYTLYTTSDSWLEGFLSQNAGKFEKVRFRDDGDQDLEFSDEIKLKISRYTEKHGAGTTAELTGLSPKTIYHWRRAMKAKGHDLTADIAVGNIKVESMDDSSDITEPRSLMQEKLHKIAANFTEDQKQEIVSEAVACGTSVTASKHKLPLPLLLNWIKTYDPDRKSGPSSRSPSISSKEGTPDHKLSHEKLKVKLPSIERMLKVSGSPSLIRHSKEYKKEVVEMAKKLGVKQAVTVTGVANSTIYSWIKDSESEQAKQEKNNPSRSLQLIELPDRNSLDNESIVPAVLKNIKKEPGVEENSPEIESVRQCGPPKAHTSTYSETKKIVRQYTDKEKLKMVQRALAVGFKQASQELDVPQTNIRRWTDLYKDRFKNMTSSSIASGVNFSSPQHSTANYSPCNESYSLVERQNKRKIEDHYSCVGNVSKRRKYTDDDRMEFVKQSEINGIAMTAQQAGISIDMMYKWRSTFLKRIRANESASVICETIQSSIDTSSAPSNVVPEDNSDLVRDADDTEVMLQGYEIPGYVETRNKSLPGQSRLCDTLVLDGDANQNKLSNSTPFQGHLTNVLDNVAAIDKEASSHFSCSATEYHSSNTSNTQNHSLAEFEQLAANQILEMTASYMEAEKQLETGQFVFEKGKSCDKNYKRVSEMSNTMETQNDSTANESTGCEFNKIQIIDIKSEAPS